MNMYTYTHTHHTYMHTYIYAYIHTYVHTHKHTYIYIYTHTHTLTYTHVHTHTNTQLSLSHTHSLTQTHTHILHALIHTYIRSQILQKHVTILGGGASACNLAVQLAGKGISVSQVCFALVYVLSFEKECPCLRRTLMICMFRHSRMNVIV